MKVDFSNSKRTEIVVREVGEIKASQNGEFRYAKIATSTDTKETLFLLPQEPDPKGRAIYVCDGTIEGKHYIFTDEAKAYLDLKNAPQKPAQPQQSERTAKVKVVKCQTATKQTGEPDTYVTKQGGTIYNYYMEVDDDGTVIKGKFGSTKSEAPFTVGQEAELNIITNEKGYVTFKKVQAAFTGGGKSYPAQPPYQAFADLVIAGKTPAEAVSILKDFKQQWG